MKSIYKNINQINSQNNNKSSTIHHRITQTRPRLHHILTAIIILTTTLRTYNCPTCVGRLNKKSPPFFNDEHYEYPRSKPTKKLKNNSTMPKNGQEKNIPKPKEDHD